MAVSRRSTAWGISKADLQLAKSRFPRVPADFRRLGCSCLSWRGEAFSRRLIPEPPNSDGLIGCAAETPAKERHIQRGLARRCRADAISLAPSPLRKSTLSVATDAINDIE